MCPDTSVTHVPGLDPGSIGRAMLLTPPRAPSGMLLGNPPPLLMRSCRRSSTRNRSHFYLGPVGPVGHYVRSEVISLSPSFQPVLSPRV